MPFLRTLIPFLQSRWEQLVLGGAVLALVVSIAGLMIPAPELVVTLSHHPEMNIVQDSAPTDGLLLEAQADSTAATSDPAVALPEEKEDTSAVSPASFFKPKATQPKTPKKIPIVNLNTAGPKELDELPGVGPKLAQRILEYRRGVGKFQRVEELLGVKGVGPKNFAKMKPYLKV